MSFDDDLKKRMALARQQGWSNDEVQRSALIERAQNSQKVQQQQRQTQQQQRSQAQQKQGSAFSAGQPLGFATSLLPFGEVLRKKLNNEQISGGDVALEAVLSAIPFGLGKAGKVIKGARGLIEGAKATKATKAVVKTTAKPVDDVLRERNLLKAMITPSEAGKAGTTVTQKTGRMLSKQSTIAPTSTIKTAGAQNKLVKYAQEEPLLRGSSSKKFQKVDEVIDKHLNEVDSLLGDVKTTVPAKNLQKSLTDVRSTISDPAELRHFDNVLTRIQGKVGNKTSYNALDINQARRVLNKELGSANRKIEMGNAPTPLDRAMLEAHGSFTDTLNGLAPKEIAAKVKAANDRVSTFIKAGPEFKKLSESKEIFGMTSQLLPKVPIISRVTESTTDRAGRLLQKAGKAGSTPIARQAQVRIPTSAASAIGSNQPIPEIPNDISQVFATPQSNQEQMVNDLYSQGVTDPQQITDALVGQGDFATPQDQTQIENGGYQTSSVDYANAAYDALQAGDVKTAKTYMDFAETMAKFEKDAGAGSSKDGPNVTKVTAQQYGLAQSGAEAVSQFRELLQKDSGVLNRSATPGRDLPIVGGFVSNAVGTGDFDAIGYNIADSILRLRTGATANESEVRKLQSQIMPRAGDSEKTVQTKIKQIEDIFGNVINLASSSSPSSDLSNFSDLFNQQENY